MTIKIVLCLLAIFTISSGVANVEETNVDFTISPAILFSSQIHHGMEWLTPKEFGKRNISILDKLKIASGQVRNNHLIASKIALISKKKFDELSYHAMNQAPFIAKMLNSVSIKNKFENVWRITNRVSAYGIPFNLGFDLKLSEVPIILVPQDTLNLLRDEGSVVKSNGRERLIIIDMTNFAQLMYRNYSYIYMKEINPNETLIVATLLASFNLQTANRFFNYPPFSTSHEMMMSNLRDQIMQIARSIQE